MLRFLLSRVNAGPGWMGVVRILVMQIAVLLTLAVAVIYYIEWTSNAAVSEFMSSSELSAPDLQRFAQSGRLTLDNGSKKECARRASP
jgi:hypothetical protein